ncbi:hypothetical protein [Aestuariibius sp. HNIBRBA575]|uniref:hypothetical protein n=1 Tax=Aestuariibius sp. HNIBRBA575 TaxID=3233343 RepID=UPI0034A23C52
MLVVGNLSSWRRNGRVLPELDGFHFTGFNDLGESLLKDVQPDVIISALMGEDFDAIELAIALSQLGFSGRYRALVRNLPNPRVVKREVRNAAPDIDFDILELDTVF